MKDFITENRGPQPLIVFFNQNHDALITFALCGEDDFVSPLDLGAAETTLYYKGIAERSEFDSLLRQAAQPKPAGPRPKIEGTVQAARAKVGASNQVVSRSERDVKSPAKRETAAMRLTSSSVAKA